MVSVDVGAQRQLSTDETGGNAEKESDAGDGDAINRIRSHNLSE